jgi:hypothetical protein
MEQISRRRGGYTRHIPYPEPVEYLDPVSKYQFSKNKESSGYFVGFSFNVGDSLTLKILKNDLVTLLHRSMVGSTADTSHQNKRVSFK